MDYKVIAIGTSVGGVAALKVLLEQLPADFPVAIAVVQHRHKDSDHLLSAVLQPYLSMPIQEVEDKDELKPGQIYLAPADYHLLIETGYFSLSTDEPVSFARPSIDVLFESAAESYGQHVVGIILTGANQDGAQGLARIKAAGGLTIVQAPDSAENPVMPRAALAATQVDAVLPLDRIPAYLNQLCLPVRR